MKKWVIRKYNKENSLKIKNELNFSELCADVLSARGFECAADAEKKLFSKKLFDPFLFKDMNKAADIINETIEGFDKICIYGDYDCDGITSTVMLYSYLECMGADVSYRLPERSEGYGLNADVVKELSEQGVKLIITVDNGISAIEEANLIYELGMKLIITDHHQVGEVLPKAEAVINPHRKDCPSIFKNLCGAGIVLKLITALEGGDYETVLNEYGELAAIGTVADIVELSSENRFIVKRGLKLIENSERCGINALIEKSKLKPPYNSSSLAFGIAPRINASGRFGSPTLAARLLLTDDENEADMLSDELNLLNQERKETENNIIENINLKINEKPDILSERVIVLSGENWHHGVIGIVSSRIVERFDKPCFIISIEGDTARGSARAFGKFSVYKALDSCSDFLIKYGGHMGAGGFSLKTEDIPKFNKRIQEYAKNEFEIMPVPYMIADKLIKPEEITIENINDLSILEPYGEGNQQPVFTISGAEITEIYSLSNGLHTKLKVNYGGVCLNLLIFRLSPDELLLKKGDKADFMVTFEIQEYNQQKNINAIVKDFRKRGLDQSKFFAARDAYEKFMRNEELPDAYYAKIFPKREELISVYKSLFQENYNTETLYMQLASQNMNYCKLCICTEIFSELKLININRFSGEISVIRNAPKANLDNSHILNSIKNRLKRR